MSHGPIWTSICREAPPGVLLHHVKSHVEKRQKDRSLWTAHELGNFIADDIADGHSDALTSTYPTATVVNISLEDVLPSIILPSDWVLHAPKTEVAPARPILTLSSKAFVSQDLREERWRAYTMDRDDSSTSDKMYSWREMTWGLSGQCGAHFSKYSQSQHLKKLLDLMPAGYNLNRWKVSGAATACPLCAADDTESHYLYCTHASAAKIREAAFAETTAFSRKHANDECQALGLAIVTYMRTLANDARTSETLRSKPYLGL